MSMMTDLSRLVIFSLNITSRELYHSVFMSGFYSEARHSDKAVWTVDVVIVHVKVTNWSVCMTSV